MRALSLILVVALLVSGTAPLRAAEQQEKIKGKSVLGRVLSSFFAKSPKQRPAAPTVDVQPVPGQPAVQRIDKDATHEQVALIKCVDAQDQLLQVNSFCLTAEGNLLAGCGSGPGQIRVYDADGNYQRSWEVPIKPESVNTAPDGTVLVAGLGKIFRFTADGQRIREAVAPHAAAVRKNAGTIRQQVLDQSKQRAKTYERQIEIYERRIASIKNNGGEHLSAADKRRLASLERVLQQMTSMRDRSLGQTVSDDQVSRQVRAMTEGKMRMASVSSDGKHVYVAAPAMVGYGFDVWKLDNELANAEKIISGLRGCCGQMDVQACQNGVFVAENSRHRVVHFTAEGKQLLSWGKRDRKGVDGFTSCCNPMNVAFGPGGDVYTAESNTGRIKRFNPKGEFVAHVGDVKLVPGCKNVSIAVTEDGSRVYMLDITRNHIVLMKKKTDSQATDDVAATVRGAIR